MSLGENICVHLGQAGCQIGMQFWEMLCLEHGIYPDGTLATDYGYSRNDGQTMPFFQETVPCKYVPRALFYDFDPDVINVIRTGCYRTLFSKDNLVSGKEDAANNYARGYYSMGQEFIDCMMDKFRHLAEATSRITGVMLMRSVGGGTGSGFGCLMLEKLSDEYGKMTKISFEVNPSPKITTAAVEPYNCVLNCHASMDHVDCCFLSDNESIYDICARSLDIPAPNYHHVNQVLAQVMSAITASFRFGGNLNTDITELQTNLVPYPRIHFPILSYAPLIPFDKVHHSRFEIHNLVRGAFSVYNQMLKCPIHKGKYMASTLLFRGDITSNDINGVLAKLKYNKSLQFVDWTPTGFKIGMSQQPPISVPGSSIGSACRAVVGMMNNTAIAQTWQRVLKKFDLMYYRRAFVHWYLGEGMEEAEFADARENLEALMRDFHEIGISGDEEFGHPEYRSHQDIRLHGSFL